MALQPTEHTLELIPTSRFDVIDVNARITEEAGDLLLRYPKALYCSYHTTAGYLEESLLAHLNHCPTSVEAFVQSFQTLFPEGADYRHDQMELRLELSEEQRRNEPRNADSHLTFISSGLENCVTYTNRPGSPSPAFFIDLDGVNGKHHRKRRTTVLGFNQATIADRIQLPVPVSNHPIDSVNLRDPRLGFFEQLNELLAHYDITKGRVDIRLSGDERHAGLTVNEYETLLMTHDLVDVLSNPLRFMAEKGKNMLRDPRAIPTKAKDYAKYDLVHVINQFIDATGLNGSLVERVLDKMIRMPAEHFLRMKRGVSLLVSDTASPGVGQVMQGTYQSPILVQWRKGNRPTARSVDVTFVRFE